MATSKQIAVAHAKFEAVLDPVNAPSDTEIIEKVYGYDKELAHHAASGTLASVGVQTEFRRLLDAKIPDKKLTIGLNNLTTAKDPVLDRKTGKVIAKTPNHSVRLATIQTVMKAKGLLDDAQVSIDNRSVIFSGKDTDSEARMLSITEKLDRLTAKLAALPTTGCSKPQHNANSDADKS